MKKQTYSLSLLILAFIFQSCASLKPYEMVYVNDPEMQMGIDSGKDYENYIYKIREGATPAGTTKSSGGCGCN